MVARAPNLQPPTLRFPAPALVAVALAAWLLGCEDVTVNVLSPAASAAASTCAPPAVAACAGQLDDECKDEKQCCSGACVAEEGAKKRCARVAACASFCELCAVGADCCSGRCAADTDGALRCQAGDCLAQGELCRADADCCTEAGPARCVEDPVGLKAKRCRLDSSGPPCTGDGVRCADAAACCGGFCIGGGAPDPICASDCVPDGAPCTTPADCCTASALCSAVEGVDSCVVVVP